MDIEHAKELIEFASLLIEAFAVVVIIGGFVRAFAAYFRQRRALGAEGAFHDFLVQLGLDLLIGLEILVLADVIDSITVKPSVTSLAVLAFLVVLRTILSWSTSLQVEGRWPWQPDLDEERQDA